MTAWIVVRKVLGLVIIGCAVFFGGVVYLVTADLTTLVEKMIIIAVASAIGVAGWLLWREDHPFHTIIKFFKKLKEEYDKESTRT